MRPSRSSTRWATGRLGSLYGGGASSAATTGEDDPAATPAAIATVAATLARRQRRRRLCSSDICTPSPPGRGPLPRLNPERKVGTLPERDKPSDFVHHRRNAERAAGCPME